MPDTKSVFVHLLPPSLPCLLSVSEVFSQACRFDVEAPYLLWPLGLPTIPEHPLFFHVYLAVLSEGRVPLTHPRSLSVFTSVQ